ncbi:MAG: DUF4381 domain-containing protein [Cellvibrionales bacterium]|nr:DUF4381 domain-containing protein [Cellvibrionales bacterium]
MQSPDDALLSQLKDIHLPESIGVWPLAPGWWTLALLGLVFLAGITYLLIQYKKRNKYRQQALALLKQLVLTNTSDALAINQLVDVIKRTIKASGNDSAQAALSNTQAFQTLLKQTMNDDEVRLLTESRYQANPNQTLPIETLINRVSHWIKHHKL